MERQTIRQLVRRQMATTIITTFARGYEGSGWHLIDATEVVTAQDVPCTVITFRTEYPMRELSGIEYNTYRVIVEEGS